MGVKLAPLINPQVLTLENLRGRSFAVDAANQLHQFLANIRTPDGVPLKDREGRITSHLVGLLYRTTRLITEYNLHLIFVFDGKPPDLKSDEIAKRQKQREQAEHDYKKALAKGDLKTAFSKAVRTGRLTRSMAKEAQQVLTYLGIPFVQAPGEGEAQAAYMVQRGDAWATASRDFDTLLFGAPRLLRYLTLTGRKRLPSKGTSVPLQPELIDLHKVLSDNGISREQLVDMALLIGTDFNSGVPQIGPKTALKLIKENNSLDNLPSKILEKLPPNYHKIRRIFLDHPITDEYDLSSHSIDKEGLIKFLCHERGFSETRVIGVIDRMKKVQEGQSQKSLDGWSGDI
ncbi:MAG: flap endonuclease-1 [Candidatus Thorarchaeota archaeon]